MSLSIKISLCLVLLTAGFALADVGDYAVKKVKKEVPKELPAETQKLLSEEAIVFSTKDGKTIAEIWLAKEIAANVKDAKKVTYRDIPQSAIMGAVRFDQQWTDYRKQNIKPGVYTMRFSMQPQDGDHMGTAPHPSFVVLIAAKFDPKAGPYEYKEMVERSAAGINTTHPAVLLLFPNEKGAPQPKLEARPNEHVILSTQRTVSSGGKKLETPLGIGLALVGHAAE